MCHLKRHAQCSIVQQLFTFKHSVCLLVWKGSLGLDARPSETTVLLHVTGQQDVIWAPDYCSA
jgi:hypothetical protein